MAGPQPKSRHVTSRAFGIFHGFGVDDDRLAFTDMAHYTMVKNTTFNGVKLPSIATYDPGSDKVAVIRRFGYDDYRNRLS